MYIVERWTCVLIKIWHIKQSCLLCVNVLFLLSHAHEWRGRVVYTNMMEETFYTWLHRRRHIGCKYYINKVFLFCCCCYFWWTLDKSLRLYIYVTFDLHHRLWQCWLSSKKRPVSIYLILSRVSWWNIISSNSFDKSNIKFDVNLQTTWIPFRFVFPFSSRCTRAKNPQSVL